MKGSKYSAEDRKRILQRFQARPKKQTIARFAMKEGVSVGTLYAWTKGGPAKPAKASGRKIRVALPPEPKMSEVEALRFENDILRRMVKLARSQGFDAVVDLAWGAPR